VQQQTHHGLAGMSSQHQHINDVSVGMQSRYEQLVGIRRGFLQHRRRQLQDFGGMPGAAWLFFGCRRESEDFLYRADFEGFEKDGTLSQLHIAYSRAQVRSLFGSPALRHGPVASGPCLLPLTKSTYAAPV